MLEETKGQQEGWTKEMEEKQKALDDNFCTHLQVGTKGG